MNVAESRIVLRARTLAELLDLACSVCGSGALGLYVKLSMAVLLPVYAACLLARYLLDWSWLTIWIGAWVASSLLQGVFTIAASRWLFAEARVGAVLGVFFRRLLDLFGAWLASIIYLACGAALLVALPYTWAHVLIVREASLLEKASPVAAIQRGARFVRSDLGRAFTLQLALSLAQLACIVLTELMLDGVVDGVLQLGEPPDRLLSEYGSPYALLGLFLSVPYVATARFLAYIDGRTRGDGWDIQVRFLAMAAEQHKTLGVAR